MRIHRIFPQSLSSVEHLHRSFAKANESGARRIWIQADDWSRLRPWNETSAFEWIVEVPWSERTRMENADDAPPARWVLASDGSEPDLQELAGFWADRQDRVDLLIRPRKNLRAEELLAKLPRADAPLFFEFLPWREDEPFRMSASEIRSFLGDLDRLRPDSPIRPYPGLEAWDDRIDPRLELEPLANPQLERRPFEKTPPISIVIPTHNNSGFIPSVLRNLFRQDFPREDYEILLVDDGSQDDTIEAVHQVLNEEAEPLNFTFFHFARTAQRKTGDNHYRAGIARNLGAKRARGKWLLFIDSDIVVRPGFLRAMLEASDDADVIQCERHHIKPEFCVGRVDYDGIRLGAQTFIEEAGYWGPFFETPEWQELPQYWKYTCTYCLMLEREEFLAVGRFKRNFTTYGFEDVDLGYELHKRGRRFKLLHEKTLHLTPTRHRSEYGHSPAIRRRLLARTAKTFFRQHLEPEIFDLMPSLMIESVWWPRLKRRFAKSKDGPGSSLS